MRNDLKFAVRADLFRVAQQFTESTSQLYRAVRVEPLIKGGVVMVGWDGVDLIALEDREAFISRAANILISKSMTNMAVDLCRRVGPSVRIVGEDGLATIKPDAGTLASRDFDVGGRFPDWRAALAPHPMVSLEPSIRLNARANKKVCDAAIGLARASGGECELIEPRGGIDATLFTFPAWPGAVAVCRHTPDIVAARADISTTWIPPAWTQGLRVAEVL